MLFQNEYYFVDNSTFRNLTLLARSKKLACFYSNWKAIERKSLFEQSINNLKYHFQIQKCKYLSYYFFILSRLILLHAYMHNREYNATYKTRRFIPLLVSATFYLNTLFFHSSAAGGHVSRVYAP